MAGRIQDRPDGISVTSPWPYAEMPESKLQKRRPTGWVLAISTDPDLNGLVTFYPAGTGKQVLHIDNGTLWGKKITTKPFYRIDNEDQAERFVTAFCSLGYTTNKDLLPHQGGAFWAFNWSSLTNATVAVASQIADHFFNDRREEAWALGHAFEEQLRTAENAYHEAKGK